MSVTLKDIANKTEFDVSTVSRVLNGYAEKHGISESTQDLILRVADDLGYRPNKLARGLRTKETKNIGIILPDISNPFFATITRHVQETLSKHGYSLIVNNSGGDTESEMEYINLMSSWDVDGLIIIPSGESADNIRKLYRKEEIFIFLDRYIEGFEVPSVTIDNYKGALDATNYLIEKGHRRIGLAQGLEGTSTNKKRLAGYKEALRRHKIDFDENLVRGESFGKESGYRSSSKLFEMSNPPTAILALSDMITLGVLRAVDERDLSIPDDISIISFDDIQFASFIESPLTAISQPTEEMGVKGAELILDVLNDEEGTQEQSIVLEPTLTVRESVRER